jgi:hypothetical protein
MVLFTQDFGGNGSGVAGASNFLMISRTRRRAGDIGQRSSANRLRG